MVSPGCEQSGCPSKELAIGPTFNACATTNQERQDHCHLMHDHGCDDDAMHGEPLGTGTATPERSIDEACVGRPAANQDETGGDGASASSLMADMVSRFSVGAEHAASLVAESACGLIAPANLCTDRVGPKIAMNRSTFPTAQARSEYGGRGLTPETPVHVNPEIDLLQRMVDATNDEPSDPSTQGGHNAPGHETSVTATETNPEMSEPNAADSHDVSHPPALCHDEKATSTNEGEGHLSPPGAHDVRLLESPSYAQLQKARAERRDAFFSGRLVTEPHPVELTEEHFSEVAPDFGDQEPHLKTLKTRLLRITEKHRDKRS